MAAKPMDADSEVAAGRWTPFETEYAAAPLRRPILQGHIIRLHKGPWSGEE